MFLPLKVGYGRYPRILPTTTSPPRFCRTHRQFFYDPVGLRGGKVYGQAWNSRERSVTEIKFLDRDPENTGTGSPCWYLKSHKVRLEFSLSYCWVQIL